MSAKERCLRRVLRGRDGVSPFPWAQGPPVLAPSPKQERPTWSLGAAPGDGARRPAGPGWENFSHNAQRARHRNTQLLLSSKREKH